jgi:hypothetical protein
MRIPWKPTLDSERRPFPRIFLSASVPALERDQRFLTGPAAPRLMVRVIETRVRDAVASFVVHLLKNGGQLIFGGHPTIVPMVAAAARNFSPNQGEHRPILLYQSEQFRTSSQSPAREEIEKLGLAQIYWVPTRPNEATKQFDIDTPYLRDDQKFHALCEEEQRDQNAPAELVAALVVLRVVMFLHLKPQAILSMGGMEGIGSEASLFHKLLGQEFHREPRDSIAVHGRSRAFALKSTYGATAQLQREGFHFIDESFFSQERQSSRTGSLQEILRPQTDMRLIDKQLTDPIRYDGIMQDFVRTAVDIL